MTILGRWEPRGRGHSRSRKQNQKGNFLPGPEATGASVLLFPVRTRRWREGFRPGCWARCYPSEAVLLEQRMGAQPSSPSLRLAALRGFPWG